MKVLDPGHEYLLAPVDGGPPVLLTFVKRNWPASKYPGNHDAHPGTLTQEVLRAVIDRSQYLDGQIPCPENSQVIALMRQALALLEQRHIVRHGGAPADFPMDLETLPFCPRCGHIMCYCAETAQ